MEIKVFKDVSKKDSLFSGLTVSQWLLIGGMFVSLAADIANMIYQIIPVFLLRLIVFPILGLVAMNALYRPHGFTFSTWLKLYLKFQTTVQTRTYIKENERMNKYGPKDFKKAKTVKEAQSSETKN